jgi:hypothetical protein
MYRKYLGSWQSSVYPVSESSGVVDACISNDDRKSTFNVKNCGTFGYELVKSFDIVEIIRNNNGTNNGNNTCLIKAKSARNLFDENQTVNIQVNIFDNNQILGTYQAYNPNDSGTFRVTFLCESQINNQELCMIS